MNAATAQLQINSTDIWNRRDELKGKRFRIIGPDSSTGEMKYWAPNANGYVDHASYAGIYTLEECLTYRTSRMKFELLEEPGELKIGEVMTYERAKERQSELAGRIVLLRLEDGSYFKEPSGGITSEVNQAHRYTIEAAISHCDFYRYTPNVILMEPVTSPVVTPPPKERILLTIRQAQSHADKVGAKMCRWVIKDHPDLWAKSPFGCGYTANVDEAQQFKVATIIRDYADQPMLIELVDQDVALEVSKLPFKLCEITEALPAALIEGLKVAPANETYHGLVLKHLGKMPPSEITEYEKLKEWIEFNCEPKRKIAVAQRAVPPTPPARVEGAPFNIPLRFTEDRAGRRYYRSTASGSANFRLTAETMAQFARDADNIDSILDYIQEELDSDAWDNTDPEMREDPESVDHGEVSGYDAENQQWNYQQSSEERRRNLIAYLRTILPREQQEQLGIAP